MKRRIRLLAYNVRSLWNVGSFFRTCDAFEVERIYLTGYTGQPPRKEITKTALGAENWVPWEHAQDPKEVMMKLKEEGVQLLALERAADAIDVTAFSPSDNICMIVGHELEGVPEELRAMCSATICIPMLGQKESLNVAVATGVALHCLRFRAS